MLPNVGTLGYTSQKRAWNSGFHTGMGKRHGNRITGQLATVCSSDSENNCSSFIDVKRYIDWLTGYPGKRHSEAYRM